MFRTLIHTLHPTLYYLIISLIYVGFALIAYTVATQFLTKKRKANDHLDEVASISLGTINGAYSIVLGFILFLVWNNYQTAMGLVVDEGSKLGVIKESSRALPPNVANKIQTGTELYIKQVMENEWPAMAQGKSSPQVSQTLSALYTSMQQYVPDNSATQAFYNSILSALNEVKEKRNHRLSMLSSPIPTAWYVFIFIAAFITIFLNSLTLRQSALQLTTHILLVLVISFFITAITALSYPFSGFISVSKELLIHSG
ncbi:bestrophin-like domain [Legionella saoudiensis]|uniref:bestrophin-like domain n=1 Tax=Legionella saoudiensis TaxID=1750561 RepID=UPI000731122D|nr:DUF4239 domain-containing protein [Legionella saoudiensis]